MISICGIALGLAVVVAPAGNAVVQTRPPDTAPVPGEQPGSADSLDDDQADLPSAERLLRMLRKTRPLDEVIAPGSALKPAVSSERLELRPEGTAVVDWSGLLVLDDNWWTHVRSTAKGRKAVKLLPNAALEVMVRTSAGSATEIEFSVYGELTVYEDENYLLVQFARRITQRPPAPQPPRKDAETDSDGKGRPEAGDGDAVAESPSEDSVESVLERLQREEPKQNVMPPAAVRSGPRPRTVAGASHTLAPDGTPLVDRPGRIVRDGSWWTFAFESDHPDSPEAPLKLLPANALELMVRASDEGKESVVFLLSGEVTLFQDESFLLPRFVIRRISSDNLTK